MILARESGQQPERARANCNRFPSACSPCGRVLAVNTEEPRGECKTNTEPRAATECMTQAGLDKLQIRSRQACRGRSLSHKEPRRSATSLGWLAAVGLEKGAGRHPT
jgi:hypothetical protein